MEVENSASNENSSPSHIAKENKKHRVNGINNGYSEKHKSYKSDYKEYETVFRLHKCIDTIRKEYREDWKSKQMRIRQRAVALYFIDKLALRAGNEKDEDQTDTVGCCSLRVEHIELHEKKDNREYVVVFDFLGKNSIRYYNEVPVEKRVFKNLQIFKENKNPCDYLFDHIDETLLNKYLNELMKGLTAKVFHTYNCVVPALCNNKDKHQDKDKNHDKNKGRDHKSSSKDKEKRSSTKNKDEDRHSSHKSSKDTESSNGKDKQIDKEKDNHKDEKKYNSSKDKDYKGFCDKEHKPSSKDKEKHRKEYEKDKHKEGKDKSKRSSSKDKEEHRSSKDKHKDKHHSSSKSKDKEKKDKDKNSEKRSSDEKKEKKYKDKEDCIDKDSQVLVIKDEPNVHIKEESDAQLKKISDNENESYNDQNVSAASSCVYNLSQIKDESETEEEKLVMVTEGERELQVYIKIDDTESEDDMGEKMVGRKSRKEKRGETNEDKEDYIDKDSQILVIKEEPNIQIKEESDAQIKKTSYKQNESYDDQNVSGASSCVYNLSQIKDEPETEEKELVMVTESERELQVYIEIEDTESEDDMGEKVVGRKSRIEKRGETNEDKEDYIDKDSQILVIKEEPNIQIKEESDAQIKKTSYKQNESYNQQNLSAASSCVYNLFQIKDESETEEEKLVMVTEGERELQVYIKIDDTESEDDMGEKLVRRKPKNEKKRKKNEDKEYSIDKVIKEEPNIQIKEESDAQIKKTSYKQNESYNDQNVLAASSCVYNLFQIKDESETEEEKLVMVTEGERELQVYIKIDDTESEDDMGEKLVRRKPKNEKKRKKNEDKEYSIDKVIKEEPNIQIKEESDAQIKKTLYKQNESYNDQNVLAASSCIYNLFQIKDESETEEEKLVMVTEGERELQVYIKIDDTESEDDMGEKVVRRKPKKEKKRKKNEDKEYSIDKVIKEEPNIQIKEESDAQIKKTSYKQNESYNQQNLSAASSCVYNLFQIKDESETEEEKLVMVTESERELQVYIKIDDTESEDDMGEKLVRRKPKNEKKRRKNEDKEYSIDKVIKEEPNIQIKEESDAQIKKTSYKQNESYNDQNVSAASSCVYNLFQIKDESETEEEELVMVTEGERELQVYIKIEDTEGEIVVVESVGNTKRKIDLVDEAEEPMMIRKKPRKEKKEKKYEDKEDSVDEDTQVLVMKEDTESDDDMLVAERMESINRKKSEVNMEGPETPKKRDKQEEDQEVWKWWEEEKREDGVKWTFLEHKGPVFAPPYECLPDNINFFYDGQEMKLSQDAEEVATFYAKMLDHDYTMKAIFNYNFFKDWRDVMTSKEREKIKDFYKCNFRQIHTYFMEIAEENGNRTKEEQQALKEKNETIRKEYGYCTVDGHREKIGTFKIAPPGLFRGRGENLRMGMLKKRVRPEDVLINCSKDSKIPTPPDGHTWKEVRHDNSVTWLASWTENVQNKVKYVMLNPTSKLKSEKEWEKYETARRLHKCIDKIRKEYREDWKSKQMRIRQRAVALYFIDKLALRAGNEKDEDQTDTVGCCSLRVEHIELHEKKDNREYVVVFDFLGKDSIRYYNEVPVEKRVFKNLRLFKENTKPGNYLFDRLNATILNKYLNELMDGLTAKVFRTYNISCILQKQLEKLTDPNYSLSEMILAYNRANRAVAILCNHQRSVPKSHHELMEKLKEKIDAKKEAIAKAQLQVKEAQRHSRNGTVKEKLIFEWKKEILARLKEQLVKLEVQEIDRDENKTIGLKRNDLDPRISVAWCIKYNVPIEKIYTKTQRDKYCWAIDTVDADYVF